METPQRDRRFDFSVLNLLNDIAYLVIHSHPEPIAAAVMQHLEAARRVIIESIKVDEAGGLSPEGMI